MRLQSCARLFVIGLIAAVGLLGLLIGRDTRFVQAQAAATATPRSVTTPITGISITYTVKSGDSFNAIARQFNLTPQQLQALNPITDTGRIRVGQVLIVGMSTATPIATLTSAAAPTQPPTALPTATPALEPTATPTLAPTAEPVPTDQPAIAAVPTAIEPPTTASAPAAASVPIDVIVVGVVMFLAVIGIIIGFRTQRG